MSDTHANYLLDLGQVLRQAGEATQRDVAVATDEDRPFQEGRRMAYIEVLSLMQQQARAFDLSLHDLSLDGLDPERDLL
jgi:hypothetical protein